MKTPPSQWPKLSETLTGPWSPFACQACGKSEAELLEGTADLERWEEFDEHDKPTGVYIAICSHCNEAKPNPRVKRTLIERHPRLYSRLPEHFNRPGQFHLCVDCTLRDGWECKHPNLKANGGPGLEVMVQKPNVYHVKASRKSHSGYYTSYHPARSCTGKSVSVGTK